MAVALELLLTGDRIDAARAYELGLVNHVVEPADVEPTAIALAERIAANAPLVAAGGQGARTAPRDRPGRRRRAPAGLADAWCSPAHDAKEGATAFVEKRPPVWKGE